MILVTGATGKVGGQVLAQLLERGEPVRALARDPESARLPAGVEVVRGDLAQPDSLHEALTGVDSVFLVWPTVTADHAASASLAVIAQHARRIVYLSAHGVPDDPEEQAESIIGSHAMIERLIQASGMVWTFLRPGGFATNTLMWAPEIQAGDVVRGIYGEAGRTLIHEADIAAVGVAALTGAGHEGAKYVMTGPEVVTTAEQVRIIGEAIGRPLRFEEVPAEVAKEQMTREGMPAEMAAAIIDAHAQMVTNPEFVVEGVEKITGAPARTFRAWAADHADDFR
ncbi:NAD(P)H-binding protein [Streptosporangium soli]|nr:NAD(P)H-binding protein [Streptosporangium sp. KLBMP 9127]